MRYSLKEGVLFGIIIAAVVLLIRAFGGELMSQLIAMLVAAGVLAAVQFMVSMRHARSHDDPVSPPPPEHPQSPRRAPQDPFAHETNQAWTGLNSSIIQEQAQREDAGSAAEEVSSEHPPLPSNPSPDNPPTANHRSL